MVSGGLLLPPAVFEASSAFRTVGLSLNVTPELSTFSKLLVAGVMFLGRLGPVTLILVLSARQKAKGYVLPHEDIATG
jgi:trk system potassium uptake protein TrkH